MTDIIVICLISMILGMFIEYHIHEFKEDEQEEKIRKLESYIRRLKAGLKEKKEV